MTETTDQTRTALHDCAIEHWHIREWRKKNYNTVQHRPTGEIFHLEKSKRRWDIFQYQNGYVGSISRLTPKEEFVGFLKDLKRLQNPDQSIRIQRAYRIVLSFCLERDIERQNMYINLEQTHLKLHFSIENLFADPKKGYPLGIQSKRIHQILDHLPVWNNDVLTENGVFCFPFEDLSIHQQIQLLNAQ